MLDFSPVGTPIENRAAALSLLRPLAASGVRGPGIEASLQRTLLQALLEQGLVGEDGRFGLRPVAQQQVCHRAGSRACVDDTLRGLPANPTPTAAPLCAARQPNSTCCSLVPCRPPPQAGEVMLKALPSARPDVAAAYRQPGLGSTDLLHKLHSAGLLARGNLSGKQATYYSARLHWLKPYAKRPAPPAQAARLVPLPSGPAHRAPVAQHAARQPAASGSLQITVQRPAKGSLSRGGAVWVLRNQLTAGIAGGCLGGASRMHPAQYRLPASCCCSASLFDGRASLLLMGLAQRGCELPPAHAGSTPTAQLLQLAVGSLLAEGLEKVDTLTFRQHPVSLKAAQKGFEQLLRGKDQAVQACYRTQFGGSLLSVLQAPELAGLVQLQGVPAPTEDGWQQAGGSEHGQVQLLLKPPHPGSSAAAAAQQAAAAGPTQRAAAQPAAEADEAEFEGWNFSDLEAEAEAATAGAAAAHAPPPPVPLPQPATLAPMAAAQPPPAASAVAGVLSQVTVRAISSEHAAGAAVAALLAAPGGRIGMACEPSHVGSDPGALVISLFAPGPASSAGSAAGTCYVFDLASMPPADRKAAVRLLAAVLENPQLTKASFPVQLVVELGSMHLGRQVATG